MTQALGRPTLRLHSLRDRQFTLQFDAYILDAISSATPPVPIDMQDWTGHPGIRLADPDYGTPAPIDVLIGADIWGHLLQEGIVRGRPSGACAISTHLGWVVFGTARARSYHSSVVGAFTTEIIPPLEKLLERFWETEEPGPIPLNETDQCERIYMDTVQRDDDGRYSVQIPFRADAKPLGDSRPIALRQFYQLERRLGNDRALQTKYVDFMREYIRLGHMEVVEEDLPLGSQGYYIPHHAVTTKFRVVFNASARTSSGESLNDTQLIGPTLQDPLTDIINRFRRFPIALTADVEKMFRQIQVDPRHRRWQRIFWRESPEQPLKTYQLTTVTFGMASSPFNAIRTLRQCAEDNYGRVADENRAIIARNTIFSSFYVDDFLTSVETTQQATEIAKDVSAVLRAGHLPLRKWNSNCAEAVAVITGSRSSAEERRLGEKDATILGLHWNAINDEIYYEVGLEPDSKGPTKRSILSDIGRLYDPVGMLAPVIIVAKIFIQTLWRTGLDWDTPLSAELREYWSKFRAALPQLSTLRIPRWLGMKTGDMTIIRGFCDASTKAYAAVIYLQRRSSDGEAPMTLVASKTRVAPVKEMTIPRLELAAALLLVRLLAQVKVSLRLTEAQYRLGTDSRVALSWIQKPVTTLKQYVANRVAIIQEQTELQSWYYIRSAQNPADCASRGLTPAELISHPLWWNGPRMEENEGGREDSLTLTKEEMIAEKAEERPPQVFVGLGTTPARLMTLSQGQQIPLVRRFASLQRLLHTTAFIMRFRPCSRNLWRKPFLEAEEIQNAFRFHVGAEQREHYGPEMDRSRVLLPLNPFRDEHGLLRVGGRLTNASLSYNQRHPLILPKKGPLAHLLVNNAHVITLHGGIAEMLQYIRRTVWIIQGRALIKQHVQRCVTCRLHQKTMEQQRMADLPRVRVTVAPPFSNSGVDYAGPFLVKHGTRRTAKSTKTYAVIFVCMVTKAVHIELAEDLSARGFLDVFDRFVGRRGYCKALYSDNGTQFVGAQRIMARELEAWRSSEVYQGVADAGVAWHFITPASPHHGGLWEAAVKSAKRHLLRAIGKQVLRSFALGTLLIRIEACLNSRPLIALYDDPEAGLALTPGDFLIGRPLVARPELQDEGVPENRLRYYQLLQRIQQQFWRRWSEEYLVTMQRRDKWAQGKRNLATGDVVAIRHEDLPPTKWRLGRVVEVHPGADGLVRTATIEYTQEQSDGRRSKKQCQRPVQKLCRLLGPDDDVLNGGSAGEHVQESTDQQH